MRRQAAILILALLCRAAATVAQSPAQIDTTIAGITAAVQAIVPDTTIERLLSDSLDAVVPDTARTAIADTVVKLSAALPGIMNDSVVRLNDSIAAQTETPPPAFHPNPQKSLWLAFAFPGLGQIYNRKYWKLPIIYGLGVGVGFAISFTNSRYREYMIAYQNYSSARPDPALYEDLVPKGYPESSISGYLKNQMNSYRRSRDISIVAAVAVYALTIIDAFVDAQLSDFDVSPDLSMKVKPTVQEDANKKPAVGVGMQVKF